MYYIWRFQCDYDGSDLDPNIQVFLGIQGDINGVAVKQNFNDPVTIKFSQLNEMVAAAGSGGTGLSDAIAAIMKDQNERRTISPANNQ